MTLIQRISSLGVLQIVHFGREVGSKTKNELLSDVVGWGVSECSGRPIFIFLLNKIGFPPRQQIILSQTILY